MGKMGKNDYHYTEAELRKIINSVARRRLGISGKEAIRIVISSDWKRNKDNFSTWAWLDSLIFLLPEGKPRHLKHASA